MIKKLRVAHVDFEIQMWTTDTATALARYGECDNHKNIIKLDPDIKGFMLLETLIHEITHAIYWYYDIQDEDIEERVVSKLGVGWAQVYRDNPELIKLISKLSKVKQ